MVLICIISLWSPVFSVVNTFRITGEVVSQNSFQHPSKIKESGMYKKFFVEIVAEHFHMAAICIEEYIGVDLLFILLPQSYFNGESIDKDQDK